VATRKQLVLLMAIYVYIIHRQSFYHSCCVFFCSVSRYFVYRCVHCNMWYLFVHFTFATVVCLFVSLRTYRDLRLCSCTCVT